MDLFAPLTLRCGLRLPNRLALAPLTNSQSHADGTCSEQEHRWLVSRAAGGFGWVSTCAAHVSLDGRGFEGQLGVWGDHQLPGLTRLAAAIHQTGAVGSVQLYHGGARAPSALTGQQPWSASAFEDARTEAVRAATPADIEGVVVAFRDAAIRAGRAGFRGVEIHGAHGYLFSQFLSRTLNRREDAWGGDLAGRARLLRSTLRAVRAAVPGLAVAVRLSPEDFGYAHGLDLDETLQVATWLAEDGADIVHASLWDVHRHTTKRPDDHPLPLFRAAIPAGVALAAAGKVWTGDDAREVLARGADLVVVGRAAILDPRWPDRVARRGEAPIRGPLTPDQLEDIAVSARFVTYLKHFRGLVVGGR